MSHPPVLPTLPIEPIVAEDPSPTPEPTPLPSTSEPTTPPLPVTSTSEAENSQIAALETRVAVLEALIVSLSAQLVSHDELLKKMVFHADLQSTIIDCNEYLIHRLMKKVPAQGDMS